MDFLANKTSYDPKEENFESIFSLDDKPNLDTLLALKIDNSSEDETHDLY